MELISSTLSAPTPTIHPFFCWLLSASHKRRRISLRWVGLFSLYWLHSFDFIVVLFAAACLSLCGALAGPPAHNPPKERAANTTIHQIHSAPLSLPPQRTTQSIVGLSAPPTIDGLFSLCEEESGLCWALVFSLGWLPAACSRP